MSCDGQADGLATTLLLENIPQITTSLKHQPCVGLSLARTSNFFTLGSSCLLLCCGGRGATGTAVSSPLCLAVLGCRI